MRMSLVGIGVLISLLVWETYAFFDPVMPATAAQPIADVDGRPVLSSDPGYKQGWKGTPEYKKKADRFTAWLKANGAVVDKLELHNFAWGRGVRFAKCAKRGEVVAAVPYSLALNCRGHPAQKWFPWHALALGDKACIAVRLLVEKHSVRSSLYAPYFDMLPKRVPLPAFTLPETGPKLAALLQDPAAVARVMTMREERDALYTHLVHKYPFVYDPEKFTRDELTWALEIVLSRAIPHAGLVPLVDMVNYHPFKGLPPRYEEIDNPLAPIDRIQVIINRYVESNEELFMSYGPELAGTQTVEQYGFVPNLEHDYVELAPNPHIPDDDRIRKLVFARNLIEPAHNAAGFSYRRFMFHKGFKPEDVLDLYRTLHLEGEDLLAALDDPRATRGMVSIENEVSALGAYKAYLQQLLKSHQSPIETDRQELEQMGRGVQACIQSEVRQLVLRARLQRKMLQRSAFDMAEVLHEMRVRQWLKQQEARRRQGMSKQGEADAGLQDRAQGSSAQERPTGASNPDAASNRAPPTPDSRRTQGPIHKLQALLAANPLS